MNDKKTYLLGQIIPALITSKEYKYSSHYKLVLNALEIADDPEKFDRQN